MENFKEVKDQKFSNKFEERKNNLNFLKFEK